MKMKHNIIKLGMIGLMGCMTFTSCSDFLEIEPLELITLDKFWNEEADVENVVAGCYSAMQSEAIIDRMMAWGEFRSDNLVGGTGVQNKIDLSNIFKENINASNVYTTWGEFYNVINRCNTVLHYAPMVAEKDPNYTQSELEATKAEVSAIRDLMYFYLIRAFRDVPYSTEPFLDDNQTLDLPATKFEDVLDSLILDLESVQNLAVKKYPVTKDYYQRGRITQDAIHAMLADMYLWKQDYTNAVRYADMVIAAKLQDYEDNLNKAGSNASTTDRLIDGYPLINDAYTTGNSYGTAFSSIFGAGNSTESIFELIFMKNDQMKANASVNNLYGNATTFPGYVKPADFICTDVSDGLFAVFMNKYDTRYYENLQQVGGSGTLYGINKYAYTDARVNTGTADITTTYSGVYTDGYCHANWIVYRLTDVMLMKAEALVEMVNAEDSTEVGKAQADTLLKQAFQIVNAISKRSNCSSSAKDIDATNLTTKSQMQALVLEERQRELMFEGKRWFDLVRRSRRDGNTNYLVGVVSRKGSSGGTAISSKLSRMDAIYWPYNNDEIKVNKNLVQNPAFGSGDNNSYQNTTK
ncbi:MAG: RagB/SusD family nutrient uptake outer membrane protein [Prevotella sp.]|nr:RagB/SusD family nutrient uptake outer membrane protein [Prevotella sp.]